MAGLTHMGYVPGTSLIHQLDARFKLGFLMLITLSCTNAKPLPLAVSGLFVFLLFRHCGISFKFMIGVFRYLVVLLIFIFLARSLTTPGPALFQIKGVAMSTSGMADGALIGWRFFLIISTSILLPMTTRPPALKAAIQWYLGLIPFVPERRVGTMASLIIRFIPVIFTHGALVADAQKARCIENRRNPVYRLTRLSIPMLRRTFQTADDLVLAMEARAYNEDRTPLKLSVSRRDWVSLFGVVIWAGLLGFSPI